MTTAQLFEDVGDAYLSLIHPDIEEMDSIGALDIILKLGQEVNPQFIGELIDGESWRERLIGLALAARNKEWHLGEVASRSLLDPRGISIVPAGAFMILSARFVGSESKDWIGENYDEEVFDGEVGWIVDRVRMHLHEQSLNGEHIGVAKDVGPNYGQDLQKHCMFYALLPEIKKGS